MNSTLVLFFVTLVILALAILMLGVQTFFSKRKKFPHTHVGGNREMAKRGVYCVQTQDAMERRGIQPQTSKGDKHEESK